MQSRQFSMHCKFYSLLPRLSLRECYRDCTKIRVHVQNNMSTFMLYAGSCVIQVVNGRENGVLVHSRIT